MSHGRRIAAILFGLALGLASSGLAHASTIGGAGTYTYVISLPNGASFTLTQSGPLGNVGTTTLSSSFSGSPMDGYVAMPITSGTGDNATWTELQFQYGEPASSGSNTASSILSYTFTEPDSFWATTGETSFPDDGATTYGGLLYLNVNMDGSWVDPDNISADFIDGTIHQGAWFDTYTPAGPGTDPQCTSCTITTTFTPAVSAVPEPSSLMLLGSGAAAMLGFYRRRS